MKRIFLILFLLIFSVIPSFAEKEAESLLLFPDEDINFSVLSKELENGGARILEAYTANIFRGYIPAELESALKKKYKAKVFHERIGYMGDFAPFGEQGMLAAAKWNKHVQEEPDDAPLIINMTVHKIGKKGKYINLCWNKVPDAVAYRLQISHGESFEKIAFRTATKKTCHTVMPAFWQDGVHYWRVAPVFKTLKKEMEDGEFSEPSTFAVAKSAARRKGKKPLPPNLPESTIAGRRLAWPPGQPYYRLQISVNGNFDIPAADVFTDTCSYRTSDLPIKRNGSYFFRVMSSDGLQNSIWSDPAEFEYTARPSYKNNI